METTRSFCFVRIVRLYTQGSGTRKMRKSVMMFMVDEKYHTGKVSRHLLAMLGTMAATGMQETPSRIACVTAQSMTKKKSQWHTRSAVGLLLPTIRRYWRRKDILTILFARL